MVDVECIISKLEQSFEPWEIQSFFDALPWVDEKFLSKRTVEDVIDEVMKFLKNVGKQDAPLEFADANTAVDIRDLCKWYSKDPRRFFYANESMKNNDFHEDSVEDILHSGQFSCLQIFADAIINIIDEDIEKESYED
ncbi:MAG: hypothetical protein QXP38_02440 [Nitrososphaerota archaeon]